MTRIREITAALIAMLPAVGMAEGVVLPGNAVLQFEDIQEQGAFLLPVGPFADGAVPTQTVMGDVHRQAWRIGGTGLTTLQLIQPLQDQLADQGYEIVLSCEGETCGGFDFRFGISVIAPPDMYVDLGDFRFVAARRPDGDGGEAVTVLASRSVRAGFVQVVTVGGVAETQASAPALRPVRPVQPIGDFGAALEADGHVVLADLTFETGSSSLSDGPFVSLQALAEYLVANPDRTVALVGHTDAEGSLDGNIALSRRRAAAVLERLVETYGVERGQVEAQGMGYLSPIATNLTEAGREANRRVEVIVTNTP